MKVIKTASYKKQLALKILDWHGGQWSDLYSVGSSWLAGHDVPSENISGAISELEKELATRKNNPKQFISSQEEWPDFEKSLEELEMLIQSLKSEMQKEELFNNEDDVNLNLLDN